MRPPSPAPTKDSSVGALIRYARTRRGWSQRELARRAGLGLRTITRVERDDHRHLIDPETWQHVAAALQLPTLRQRLHPVHALRDALLRDMHLPAMPTRRETPPPPPTSALQAFVAEHANLDAADIGAEVDRLLTLAPTRGLARPTKAGIAAALRAVRHQERRQVALPDSDRVHLAGHGAYAGEPEALPDVETLIGLIDDALARLTFVRDAIAAYAGIVQENESLRARMQKLTAIVFDRPEDS